MPQWIKTALCALAAFWIISPTAYSKSPTQKDTRQIASQTLRIYSQAHAHARRHHRISSSLRQNANRRMKCLDDLIINVFAQENLSEEEASIWGAVFPFYWVEETWILVAQGNRRFLQKKNRLLNKRSQTLMQQSANSSGRRIAHSLALQARINRVYYRARSTYDSCRLKREVQGLGNYSHQELTEFFKEFVTESGIYSFIEGPGDYHRLYSSLRKTRQAIKKLGFAGRNYRRYGDPLVWVLLARTLDQEESLAPLLKQ